MGLRCASIRLTATSLCRVRNTRTLLPKNILNTRKLSIYGGSNEIQRNIIAKAVLGL